MPRIGRVSLVLAAALALPQAAFAQTYWLGRKPDPDREEYVFDVPVPADAAAALAGIGRYARFRDGVNEFRLEAEGKAHTFLETPIAWDGDNIDRGRFAFLRNHEVDAKDWATVSPAGGWKAVRDVLAAQKKPLFDAGWWQVTPVVLKSAGTGNPQLKVDFNADGPFDINRHPGEYDSSVGTLAATKKPQIVPVARDKELFVAWQTWDRTKPTGKVIVAKVALAELAKGKLAAVREVPSGGTLVGFTVDATGTDYVLAAKAETFENRNPPADFVDAVHKAWRKGVMVLYAKGEASDLNSDTFTGLPFYGIGNAGSGRLAAGGDLLAAVFARRKYTPGDNIIHQEADALLVSPDLSRVPLKAGNRVSHSFDQRLIFDGENFVALHQADQFPVAGLVVEKLPAGSGGRPVPFAAFVCPTFGNDVYFELGGLAAEADGYPVLFSATHNTEGVTPATAADKRAVPWDLAMAYVTRDFDTRPQPKNPFDAAGSGVLAGGYGKAEEFTTDNFTYNPAKSDWSNREPRTFTRRVQWLTGYDADKKAVRKATAAKLVRLGEGKYLAVWEQHTLVNKQWRYEQTWATAVTAAGDIGNKQIKAGKPAAFKNLRLPRGDDAVAIPVGNTTAAGWVTAGATNKQLLLHTVDENLKYKAYPLRLP